MNLINFGLQGNDMPNELNLSNDPYIIVSSDSHAGLQCEDTARIWNPQFMQNLMNI